MKASRRRCITVLGMHRSGTSALTRAVSLCGASLPKSILPPDPSNEMGYWKPIRLIALHDMMLAEAGTAWDDWHSFDRRTLGTERLAHYGSQIVDIIKEEYGNERLFVVKDPRICRFVPFWRKLLDQIGAMFCCAIPIRNPIEVARSIGHRHDLFHTHACLLWLRHVLEAEYETRGMQRVFINYQDILRDLIQIMAHIAAQLSIDWPAVGNGINREIRDSIIAAQRHHIVELGELRKPIAFYPWLLETYKAHATRAHCPTDENAQRQLDCIRADFNSPILVRSPELSF